MNSQDSLMPVMDEMLWETELEARRGTDRIQFYSLEFVTHSNYCTVAPRIRTANVLHKGTFFFLTVILKALEDIIMSVALCV